MTWWTKSTTVLGLIIAALTAVAAFAKVISPELATLGETIGATIAAFGFRKKLQANGVK